MVHAVPANLSATAFLRLSESVFILSEGSCRGHLASCSTIAKWISRVIVQRYSVDDKVPPFYFLLRPTPPRLWEFLRPFSIKHLFCRFVNLSYNPLFSMF